MATYSVSTAKHATLVAETADTVTLTGNASFVTVFAVAGETAAPIYFTVGDNPTTATVEGNNTFVAYPGDNWTVKFDGTNTKVSLISEGATEYSVVAHQGF